MKAAFVKTAILTSTFFFLMQFISGCSSPDLKKTEARNDFNHLNCQTVEENGTFYFISNMTSQGTQKLMYLDEDSSAAAPLCGRPECTHSEGDSTCNADLESLGKVLGMTVSEDGILLCVSEPDKSVYSVYQMKTDGTARKKVRDLTASNQVDADFPTNNRRILFHRGKVYAYGKRAVLSDGEWNFTDIIVAYDLNNKKEGEILYKRPGEGSWFQVFIVGETMYIVRNSPGEIDGRETILLEIEEISIAEKTCSTIFSGKADFSAYEFHTDGTRFVFTTFEDGRVMEYDRESGTLEELTDFDDQGGEFMTMFISEDRVVGFTYPQNDRIRIIVRDFSGNTLYDVERERAGFEYMGRTFCGIDERNIYCAYPTEENTEEYIVAYPLDDTGYHVIWPE